MYWVKEHRDLCNIGKAGDGPEGCGGKQLKVMRKGSQRKQNVRHVRGKK